MLGEAPIRGEERSSSVGWEGGSEKEKKKILLLKLRG
jgi:hypothetical protein